MSNDHVYIIAEIGINHNGSVDIAKDLIDVAAEAGCDAVKFQKRNPDVCVPDDQKGVKRDTPWGTMDYIDYKWEIEFGADEYLEIQDYCQKKNIDWSASVWDLDSEQFMRDFDVPWIKIPSPMVTNHDLLKQVSEIWNHVIMSTGMSRINQIKEASQKFDHWDDPSVSTDEFWLAHCTSEYPLQNDHVNLRMIDTLKNHTINGSLSWVDKVGYSGHEKGLQVSVGAVARGAEFLERHITLDRTMWGSDQAASVEPQGLKKLVRDVRVIEKALGDGEKQIYEAEKEKMKSLRG